LQFKGERAIGSTGLVRSYHEKYPLIDHLLIYNRAYLVSDYFEQSTCPGRKNRAQRTDVVTYLQIIHIPYLKLSSFNVCIHNI